MRMLTLTQPWAQLIAIGSKKIETRSWSDPYRGPLAIHAAKGLPRGLLKSDLLELCVREPFNSELLKGGYSHFGQLPRGQIVAVATLKDIYRIDEQNVPTEPERSFGNYSPGRFAWILSDVENITSAVDPVEAMGSLGLIDLLKHQPKAHSDLMLRMKGLAAGGAS